MSLNPTKGLKAADENDEHIIRQVSTAEMLVGMGKVNDAVAMLRQMLQERPENLQVRIKLKDIYLRSEMLDHAAEECLQLARIYEARGDSNRATDYLIRAKRLNPATESKTNEEPPPVSVSSEVVRAATDNSTVKVTVKNADAETQATEVGLNLAREQAAKEHKPAARVAPVQQPPVQQPPATLIKEPAQPASPIPVEQVFVTNDTALAPLAESRITSENVSSSSVAISTLTRPETSLSVKPISRLQPSQTKRRQSRWLKFSAIAATCLVILASAAIAGLFAYDRYLDKQYASLVPIDLKQAPPSLPESYAEAMTDEQQQLTPSDQIEAVTIPSPAADTAERHQQETEREVIKPEPLPEPIITGPPPREIKPPSPAPPMIGRVNVGQGGHEQRRRIRCSCGDAFKRLAAAVAAAPGGPQIGRCGSRESIKARRADQPDYCSVAAYRHSGSRDTD